MDPGYNPFKLPKPRERELTGMLAMGTFFLFVVALMFWIKRC
jgi:hypothetical protein